MVVIEQFSSNNKLYNRSDQRCIRRNGYDDLHGNGHRRLLQCHSHAHGNGDHTTECGNLKWNANRMC